MKSPAPYVVPPSGQWDGGWSTFVIRVGTPGQEFRVLPSTAGSETFIPLVGACLSTDPPNCQALRGVNDVGGFSSTGFHANESSSWKTIGLYDLGLDARLGDIASASGLYGSDTVALGSLQQQMSGPTQPIAIGGQTVAGVVKKTWLLGLLGCNVRPSSFSTYSPLVPSLLQNLRNQSLIPSLSYSYTAGAVYASRRSYASLILGGADRSRFVPTNLTISFATDDYIAPVAGVLSIIGMNTLKGTVSFSTSGAFLAAIDSSVAEMWLPRSICDKFESAFGLTYDSTSGLYIISNDETHSQLQALNPTITFQFGNGTSNLHSANVVLPYAAFDLQASWPTFKNSTKYFPLRRAANESQYTLGRVLLQEAYLMVDFERQNFTITQALFPDAHTTTDIAAIFSLSENRASKLGTGPITGIAIGGFGLVVIMAFLVLWYRRGLWRKRRRGEDPKAEDRIAQDEPEKFYLVSPELDSVACHELPPGALAEMGVPGKWEMPATTIPQELDSIPVSRT